jgi:hypothetical protein
VNLCRSFFLVLLCCSPAAGQQVVTLHLRGTVSNATTRRPVSGARVSVAGGRAMHDDETDNTGSFDVPLRQVAAGELIRVRVEKEGYEIYDQGVVASEAKPLQVFLNPKLKSKQAVPAPSVTVSCHLSEKQSPCELYCSIKNAGLEAAHDASVGFADILPVQTKLQSDFARVQMEKSDTLPVLDPNRLRFEGIQAFTVRVPIVPPRSSISFVLWTEDENNRKACEQTERIRDIQRSVFKKFLEAVQVSGLAKDSHPPDLDLVMSGEAEEDALFVPKDVISDRGRNPVEFITPREAKALSQFRELYPALRPEFKKIFDESGECVAPVFTVEQKGGQSTAIIRFGSLDPFLYADAVFRLPGPGEPSAMEFKPTPPKFYRCGPKTNTPGEPGTMTLTPQPQSPN